MPKDPPFDPDTLTDLIPLDFTWVEKDTDIDKYWEFSHTYRLNSAFAVPQSEPEAFVFGCNTMYETWMNWSKIWKMFSLLIVLLTSYYIISVFVDVMIHEVLLDHRYCLLAQLFLSISLFFFAFFHWRSSQSFVYWTVKQIENVASEIRDVRPLATGADVLTLKNQRMIYVNIEKHCIRPIYWFVFGLARGYVISRMALVSREKIYQLTNPSNMLMLSQSEQIRARLEYTNAHLHRVNHDKRFPTGQTMPSMDEDLIAYGMYKRAMQTRARRDF